MEASGIYAACDREGVEWIVVKAIVDFADGRKSDDHQRAAAKNACTVVEAVCKAGGLDADHFARSSRRGGWASILGALFAGVVLGGMGAWALHPKVKLNALEINCSLGHRPSCRLEMDRLLLACEAGGSGEACLRAALLRLQPDLLPIEKTDPPTAELLERGCANGDGEACYSSGLLRKRGLLPNPGIAGRSFARGCELGNAFSCREYAVTLSSNAPERARLLAKACTLGSPDACSDIAARGLTTGIPATSEQTAAFEAPCRDPQPSGVCEPCDSPIAATRRGRTATRIASLSDLLRAGVR